MAIAKLPVNLEELKKLGESKLSTPEETALLTVAALCAYPADKNACIEMLDYLKGPESVSEYEKQFLRDRFRDADYVPRSYLKGATPDNNYTPSTPYDITIKTVKKSEDENYCNVYLISGGADSPREVRCRLKPSTGQWFLNEQMLLAGIRVPKAADPWA
ncbi:MAG: hypothetical protein Q4E57_09425 [Eubacteriales bacterium]|nr:hypothetical protein [Eubacteriales bacterium]